MSFFLKTSLLGDFEQAVDGQKVLESSKFNFRSTLDGVDFLR